jgi:hypothetical protein
MKRAAPMYIYLPGDIPDIFVLCNDRDQKEFLLGLLDLSR